jgi:hypothetical protein
MQKSRSRRRISDNVSSFDFNVFCNGPLQGCCGELSWAHLLFIV